MNHKEDCCCPCCQIPRLEKTIAEQAEQIAMLEKAVDTGVEAEEKLHTENQRLKEWICKECDAHKDYCKSPKTVGCNLEQALAATPQKGQDNV